MNRMSRKSPEARGAAAAPPDLSKSQMAAELSQVTARDTVAKLIEHFGVAADMLGDLPLRDDQKLLLTRMVCDMPPPVRKEIGEMASKKRLSNLGEVERILGQKRETFDYNIIQEPAERFLLHLLSD